MQTWQQTDLWGTITGRANQSRATHILEHYMPTIETVLRSGSTSSLDFTLHDDEHSFRVAQSASSLLGASKDILSDAELSLLLLSCYCHDVGMTPTRDLSGAIYRYVISGDPVIVEPKIKEDIQSFLDSEHGGATPPILPGQVTPQGIDLVEEICAYYTRSRHNDWSEHWIRTNLCGPALYSGWIDDLVALCKSHHEGLTTLRQSRFDAKLVDSPSQKLNLRYLAAALRLADVTEFSPDRTPQTILTHRHITPGSRIYWQKDHAISFHVDTTNHQIIITAETPNAVIHKAVISTADDVDAELALCSTLEREGAFQRGVIPEVFRQDYKWPWPGRVTRNIRERQGRFVYIDGSFRPDSKKILRLLSGTALYGTPLAAIRELLQNATDAIREQIAYERLAHEGPAEDTYAALLASLHCIQVRFFKSDGAFWIKCVDDGSGMTRSIIENNLLVSGSSTRGDVRALERNAKSKGFSVGRTGQFGIGSLSYFMVSDHVEIRTRRSQEAGDTDATGWKFTIDGIGQFGELATEARGAKGTEVALRIRDEIIRGDTEAFFHTVCSYIKSVIRRSPCRIDIFDDTTTLPPERLGPGWMAAAPVVSFDPKWLLGAQRHSHLNDEFATEDDRRAAEEKYEKLSRLWARISTEVKWDIFEDDIIQEPPGVVRISLPHFYQLGHPSVLFFDMNDAGRFAVDSGSYVFSFTGATFWSWRGYSVEHRSAISTNKTLAEVDLLDGKSISVNRDTVDSQNDDLVANALELVISEKWNHFLAENSSSIFNEINVAAAPISQIKKFKYLRDTPFWPIAKNGELDFAVCDAVFPLYDLCRISFYGDPSLRFRVPEGIFNEALMISTGGYAPLPLHALYGGGELIHHEMDTSGGFVGIRWRQKPDMRKRDGSLASDFVTFPDEWGAIAVVATPYRRFFNRSHFLFDNIDASLSPYRPRPARDQIGALIDDASTSAAKAAKFIIDFSGLDRSFWVYTRENHRSAYEAVVGRLGVHSEGQLLVLQSKEVLGEGIIDLYRPDFAPGEKGRGARPPATTREWEVEQID